MVAFYNECRCQRTICVCDVTSPSHQYPNWACTSTSITFYTNDADGIAATYPAMVYLPPPLDLLAYRGPFGSRNAVRRQRKVELSRRDRTPVDFAAVRVESKIFRETLRVRKRA